MPKSIASVSCFVVAVLLSSAVIAQNAPTFEKKNFSYSEWAKNLFSESITVTGPGKMIFLAGVGAEDENGKGGDILYKGDFVAHSNTPMTRSSGRWRSTAPGSATWSRSLPT
jgi:hypothetical protein